MMPYLVVSDLPRLQSIQVATMKVFLPLGCHAYCQSGKRSADLTPNVFGRHLQKTLQSHPALRPVPRPKQLTENSPALLIRFLCNSRIFNRTWRLECDQVHTTRFSSCCPFRLSMFRTKSVLELSTWPHASSAKFRHEDSIQ